MGGRLSLLWIGLKISQADIVASTAELNGLRVASICDKIDRSFMCDYAVFNNVNFLFFHLHCTIGKEIVLIYR